MAEPADHTAGTSASTGNPQVSLLMDLAKDQVAEAFQVAQALEGKARSLLQASAVFFAASQTAVAVQVAVGDRQVRPTWVAVAATVIGLIGLLGIACAALRTVRLQEPHEQLTLDVQTLSDKLITFAERNDPRVSRFLLAELASVARDRRDKNKAKVSALKKVQFWASVALGASSLALTFSMIVSYAYR